MNQPLLESLESRLFLSAAVLQDSPASSPQLASVALPLQPAAATALPRMVGSYSGTATIESVTFKFYVKISSQRAPWPAALAGRLYSAGIGGFDLPVTGTITSEGALALSGSNSTFRLRRLAATVTGLGLKFAGTMSIVQMGLPASGRCSAQKVATIPARAVAKAPNVVGAYRGYTIDGEGDRDAEQFTVSRQQGGLIWGSGGDSTMTGIVLADGRFRMVFKSSEGTTWARGIAKGSALEGEWTWSGRDGDTDHGTFRFNRA